MLFFTQILLIYTANQIGDIFFCKDGYTSTVQWGNCFWSSKMLFNYRFVAFGFQFVKLYSHFRVLLSAL